MADTQSIVDLVLDDAVAAIRFGRSVLLQATLQGHDNVLRYLLHRISSSSDLTPNPSPDQPQFSKALSAAFLGAAEQGHPHCLSSILDSGASFLNIDGLMNATNEHGETALMVAAKAGRGDCVKILLQHRPEAQVAAAEKEGNTALILAAWRGHAACVSQLLQHSPGTQVAATNDQGSTALILAAFKGHTMCVSQLLQHNPEAQVAAANKQGGTALICSAWGGHAACVNQLLQHSPEAQVVVISKSVRSALVSAVFNNHPGCVALLLAHSPSAQIAAVDGGGRSVCRGLYVSLAAKRARARTAIEL